MPLARAVVIFDAILVASLVFDFFAISRRNDAVVAKLPPLIMAIVLVTIAPQVASGRLEFLALGVLVLGAAMFGYANFLAFVKRGVTFSILSNHTRPGADRLPDHEFIAIDERLEEMRGHGWAERRDGRWTLTRAGHRVARIRATLMRLLNIEAVG